MQNDPNSPYQQYPEYQQKDPYYPGPPAKTQVLGLDYNIAGLLCYLPILAIGPILSIVFLSGEPKSNRFVRFHAVQSLMLAAIGIVLGVVLSIGGMMAMIPVVGWIIALISGLLGLGLGLGLLAVVVISMLKAYRNEMWRIPIIGGYVDRFLN